MFECEQQNGACFNDKGYATSVWPKRGAAQAARQRPVASNVTQLSADRVSPRTPANGNDDRSNRIERQHSQEMALRYCVLASIDPSDSENRAKLVEIISWFQRDIGRSPQAEAKPAPAPEPETGALPEGDENEPF